jgi:DNA-directed RNA polymerase specialized sigma24 family protein
MATADFAVFEALRPDLLRVARALLRGSRVRLGPEDLVQGALTRILAGLDAGTVRLDAVESARGFAFAAVRNLFLDEVKAHRTRFEDALDSGVRAPAPAAASPSLLVQQILEQFEPPARCFLMRVVFEERSVGEAQGLCGWPDRSPYYHLKLLLDRAREAVS